jgi:hypothetical protein
MLKQMLIDSCMIDVCSPSPMPLNLRRREPLLSTITYNLSLLILTGGYIPTPIIVSCFVSIVLQ